MNYTLNKLHFMSECKEQDQKKYLDELIIHVETSGYKPIVEILTVYNDTYRTYSCCKTCYEQLNGISMDLEDYKANPILPYKNCTRKNENPYSKKQFCICDLGFRAKRDENGRIIKK